MPSPGMEGTPQLSTPTLSWLASRPPARQVADSVWDALAEVKDIPRLRAALRFVLIDLDTALSGQLLHVSVGQPIAQVPPDCHRDHLRREPKPSEA